MTDNTITTFYKWLSLATLGVSIIGAIMFDGTAVEKFGIGALINLQFHMVFQFLSRVPFGMYQLIQIDNAWQRTMVTRILNFFSFFIMAGAVIAFMGMLNTAIMHRQYSQLNVVMTFLAMFLGGMSLSLKLRATRA